MNASEMGNVKALIFDLGGVYFTRGTAIAVAKLERMLCVPRKFLKQIFDEGGELGRKYREGRINETAFWKTVSERLNLDIQTIEKVREIWHSSYKPNPGMKRLLNSLRKRYKIAVLSNNIEERIRYLNERYHLEREFDVYVYSFDHGVLKPNPLLFKEALKRLNVEAEECVMVDDQREVLETASQLGMKTILFRSAQQLKRELVKIGVEV